MTAPFSFLTLAQRPASQESGQASTRSQSFRARAGAGGAQNFASDSFVAALLADAKGLKDLSTEKRNSLRAELGEKNLQEFYSLAQETDSVLFGKGLLTLAQRLEGQDKLDWALKLYGAVQQLGQAPGALQGLAKQAEQRMQAALGQGKTGARFEFLLNRFAKDATDYKTIVPMMAGSLVGQLAETAVMGRLAATARSGWMAAKWTPRVLAAASGYVPEFVTFGLLNRAIASGPQGSVGEDLARSAVSIGALKLMGFVGNQTFLKLHGFSEMGMPSRLTALAKFNQFAIPQFAMFSGMMLSHKLEEKFGLRQKTNDATMVTDTLTSMVSMGVGAHLGHQLLGSRFAQFQQGLRVRAEQSEAQLHDKPRNHPQNLVPAGVTPTHKNISRNPLLGPFWSLMGVDGLGGGLGGKGEVEAELSAKVEPKQEAEPSPPDETSPQPPSQPAAPQFVQHLKLNEAMLQAMERFPALIIRRHAGDEANAVHFGLNHLKWWMGLIQRDAGELGAEAMVEGGKILFGRWPEKAETQMEIENSLRRGIAQAKLSLYWEPPHEEAWWRPLWERSLAETDPAASKVLAAVLERIAKQFPETAEAWFQELADQDIDRSVAVQELRETPELKFDSALKLEFQKSLQELRQVIRQRDWAEVNQRLAELYAQAWDLQNAVERFTYIQALYEQIAKIQGPQPEGQKGGVEAADPQTLLAELRAKVETGEARLNGALWLQSRFGLPDSLPFDCEDYQNRLLALTEKLASKKMIGGCRSGPNHAHLSNLYRSLGESAKAKEHLQQGLNALLGLTRVTTENFQPELDAVQEIAEGKRFEPLPQVQAMAKMLSQGDWEEAIKFLNDNIQDPTTQEHPSLAYLADIFLQLSSTEFLRKSLQKSARTYPFSTNAVHEFADRFKVVWEEVAGSLHSVEFAALQWATLGNIFQRLGDPKMAAQSFSMVGNAINLHVKVNEAGKTQIDYDGDWMKFLERVKATTNNSGAEDPSKIPGLLSYESQLRQGRIQEAIDWHPYGFDPQTIIDSTIYLAQVLAELIPSPRFPHLPLGVELSFTKRFEEIQRLRKGLTPQQEAYVGSFLAYYHEQMGNPEIAKHAFEYVESQLRASGTHLDRGIAFVIEKLKNREWPLDPELGTSVAEAAQQLRRGKVEAALALVDSAKGLAVKAHALAYLAKQLREDYPLSGTVPPPPSGSKMDPVLLEKLKEDTLAYVKKRGELGQGLKLEWSHTGPEPAREWAYLGYVLRCLGETEAAKQYFREAHSAFDERIMIMMPVDPKKTQAGIEVENLESGDFNTPVDTTALVKTVNQLALEGNFEGAWDLLETTLGLERAIALAHFVFHLKNVVAPAAPAKGINLLAMAKRIGIDSLGGCPLVFTDPSVSPQGEFYFFTDFSNEQRLAFANRSGSNSFPLVSYLQMKGLSQPMEIKSNPHILKYQDTIILGIEKFRIKNEIQEPIGPDDQIAVSVVGDPATSKEYVLTKGRSNSSAIPVVSPIAPPEAVPIYLAGRPLRMGRVAGPDIPFVISHPQVSSKHAEIHLESDVNDVGKFKLVLRDMGSSNGTYYRGQTLAPGSWYPLENQEVFYLGPIHVRVDLAPDFAPGHSLALVQDANSYLSLKSFPPAPPASSSGLPAHPILLEQGKSFSMGRGPDNHINLGSASLHEKHAEIQIENENQFYIKNMSGDSSVGVFLKNKSWATIGPIAEIIRFADVEKIQIGEAILQNKISGPLEKDAKVILVKGAEPNLWILKSHLPSSPLFLEQGKPFHVGRGPLNDLDLGEHAPLEHLAILTIQNGDQFLIEARQNSAPVDLYTNKGKVPQIYGTFGCNLFNVQKIKFGDHGTILNEIQEPLAKEEKAVLVPWTLAKVWILRSEKSGPKLEPAAANSFPSAINHLERLPKRDLNTIPEAYRHFIPKPQDIVLFPRFLRILQETASLIAAPDRIAVRFFGPPGTAKTTIPEMIAERMGIPLLRVPFSKRTDPSDMEGHWSMEEIRGEYVPVFKEGAATVAMEHGFHLVLDEPDLARPGVLAFLNNVSAPGQYAWVRKRNGQLHRIKVHQDYRVYATENGAREIGREEHGKDFLRRFVSYYVGPWTQDEVATVLERLYGKVAGQRRWSQKVSQTLAYFHDKMRILAEGLEDPETKQTLPPLGSGVGQQLQFTPRSILRLAQRLAASGPLTPETVSRAVRAEYILPLADKGDQDLVWSQAQAIFAELAKDLDWIPQLSMLRKELEEKLKDLDSRLYSLYKQDISLKSEFEELSKRSPPGQEGQAVFLTPEMQQIRVLLTNLQQIQHESHLVQEEKEKLQREMASGPSGSLIGPEQIPTPTLSTISQKYLDGKKIPASDFVFTDQALRLIDEILWNHSLGIDVMLLGDAGEGKTEIPGQIAKLLDMAYYQKTVSSETDEEDLIGGLGRVNGKIQFIPDIVTLGTKQGGVVHLDEFLLSDTGKLESVLSPLMDGTQALIIKNPYDLIRREKGKTLFILTSNPPFGDFADRHESSGAAMSRVAVINLVDGFAMQPTDRLKILKSWMGRPIAAKEAALDPKKKILSPEPEAPKGPKRNFIAPGFRHAVAPDADGKAPTVIPLKIHPEVREKFKISTELQLDVPQAEIFEVQADGSKIPWSAETKKTLKKYADYLTRRTQIEMAPVTGKVFKILYSILGNHMTDMTHKQIILNLCDLLGRSLDASLGVGKHEWAHATIDRPSKKYDAHEPGRLYANVVGDPRMNEYAGSLRADFARQIKALYEDWPETYTEQEAEKYRQHLPHEQFADAIIYFWLYGKIIPCIENEKVIQALEQALPLLKPAFTLFPKSTQDADVEAGVKQFYDILDQAYPYYQALIPESMRELVERLERGERPEDLMQFIVIRLPMPSQQQEPVPAQDPEAEQSKQTAQPTPSSESETSVPATPAKQAAEAEVDFEADTTPMQAPAAAPQASAGSKGSESSAGEAIPAQESGFDEATPKSPPQKLSQEELQQLAQQILDKRAEQLADRFEAKDQEAFKRRKGEIEQAKQQAKGVEEEEGSTPESKPMPQPSEPESKLDEAAKQRMEAARQQALQEQIKRDLFRVMVPAKAIYAAQRLKKVLPPDDPTYLEGHFTTGKRLDRRKAVEDAINPMSDGKVMLRRLRPGERNANVVLVSDISSSMKDAGAVDNALKASAAAIYLGEQLKLNYGEILFGEKVRIAKPLGKPLQSYQKKNELLNLKKEAFLDRDINGGTNIREPLALALDWIQKKRAGSNFIILITDGGENVCNYPKTLQELQDEAEEQGIHLLVLAMGDAKRYVPVIFKHYKFVADDGSDIPDKIVELFSEAHRRRLGK